MKAPTQKDFIKHSHIDPALIRAVVRQLGDWQTATERLPDIASHGAQSGYSGFIYYTETTAFARKNKTVILKLAEDLAQEIGEGDAAQLIAGFNCFKNDPLSPSQVARLIYGSKPRDDDGQADWQYIFNALAWFAAEEVARSYSDWRYDVEND